jgi:hypothetical protein
MTVSITSAGALRLAHAVADHLAAAEFHFLAVDRVVLLDLDEQFGVGQAHAVADGGAEHLGIGRRESAHLVCPSVVASWAFSLPITTRIEAVDAGGRPRRHQFHRARWPGSKRTAVPAAMFSRMP